MIIIVIVCSFLFFLNELFANLKLREREIGIYKEFIELTPFDLAMVWTILMLGVLDFGNDVFFLVIWWSFAKWIIYSGVPRLYVYVPKRMKMFILTFSVELNTITPLLFSVILTLIAVIFGIIMWDIEKHYLFSAFSIVFSISLVIKYYDDISKMKKNSKEYFTFSQSKTTKTLNQILYEFEIFLGYKVTFNDFWLLKEKVQKVFYSKNLVSYLQSSEDICLNDAFYVIVNRVFNDNTFFKESNIINDLQLFMKNKKNILSLSNEPSLCTIIDQIKN